MENFCNDVTVSPLWGLVCMAWRQSGTQIGRSIMSFFNDGLFFHQIVPAGMTNV